ncbi:MAG: CopG family transcriptional regulator [Phycisphaerae bacterium]|nr:CopG family transcriptional regulator [Phycisphaerae bacterium]
MENAADKVTIKIPRELYANLQGMIRGTGFRSVTEFVVHVLRDVASGGKLRENKGQGGLSHDEIELVRQRLRALGYIE